MLRKIELTDANDIFRTIDSYREYFRKWLPFVDYTTNVTDSVAFIESIYECPVEMQECVFVLRVEEVE